MGDINTLSVGVDEDRVGVRRPSEAAVGLSNSAPPEPEYVSREESSVNERAGSGRDDAGGTPRLSGRTPGLRSGSSMSTTASPASVVSIPFAVPWRAPAEGTRSIGRGPRRGSGPERTRLFDVSSLRPWNTYAKRDPRQEHIFGC